LGLLGAAESMFEYGSPVGVWRVLRLFEERGLPLTIFGCAMAIERNPDLAIVTFRAGDAADEELVTLPEPVQFGER